MPCKKRTMKAQRARAMQSRTGALIGIAGFLGAIALFLAVLTVLYAINTFGKTKEHGHESIDINVDHPDTPCACELTLSANASLCGGTNIVTEILTSRTHNITIPITTDNDCGSAEIGSWRLHRVDKQVMVSMHGVCHDVDGNTDTIGLDIDMSNFPVAYSRPSPNQENASEDVKGDGSAVGVESGHAVWVEVDGDSVFSCIDVDLRMGGNNEFANGEQVNFAFTAHYQVAE